MNKIHIVIAAFIGFSGVALGAFGGHGLKNLVDAEIVETYRTGILYHLIHSVVLLAISLSGRSLTKSYWTILIGILLFSFSLYLYVLTSIKFLVFITPVGGVALLVGWSFIVYETYKTQND